MQRFIISGILGVCLFGGCEAKQKFTCALDPADAMSWTQFDSEQQPELPYTKIYTGCSKTVIYVAAKHGNDPESKTYKLVSDAFANHPVDMLVVEGFPHDFGLSPQKMTDYANQAAGTPQDIEPLFAIRQANIYKAKFTGGEPTDKALLAMAKTQGISAQDMLAVYITRKIEQWQRSNEIKDYRDPALSEHVQEMAQYFTEQTGIDPAEVQSLSSLSGYKNWYQTTNAMDYDTHFRFEDAWPSSAIPDPRPINGLTDKLSDARETGIIQVIADMVQTHDTVLIVYGGSHEAVQAPALEAAFGLPSQP